MNAHAYEREEGHQTGAESVGLPSGIRACLFDLDGVLTKTAHLHAAAWKATFDPFLLERSAQTQEPYVPFDSALDYDRYVDGRARDDGVREFLASRGIAEEAATIGVLGDRKNDLVHELIRRRGLSRTRARCGTCEPLRMRACAGRSSQPVRTVAPLSKLRVSPICSRCGSMQRAPRKSIFGASPPRTPFSLQHGHWTSSQPKQPCSKTRSRASLPGVSGEFGFVVGVNRTDHAEALRRAGADLVISDLGDLLRATMSSRPRFSVEPWSVRETQLDLDSARQDRIDVRPRKRAHRTEGESRRGRAVRLARQLPELLLRAAPAASRGSRLWLPGVRVRRS